MSFPCASECLVLQCAWVLYPTESTATSNRWECYHSRWRGEGSRGQLAYCRYGARLHNEVKREEQRVKAGKKSGDTEGQEWRVWLKVGGIKNSEGFENYILVEYVRDQYAVSTAREKNWENSAIANMLE